MEVYEFCNEQKQEKLKYVFLEMTKKILNVNKEWKRIQI